MFGWRVENKKKKQFYSNKPSTWNVEPSIMRYNEKLYFYNLSKKPFATKVKFTSLFANIV